MEWTTPHDDRINELIRRALEAQAQQIEETVRRIVRDELKQATNLPKQHINKREVK